MTSKGPRMPGDGREPDEGDRLIRWAEELGLLVHVYDMAESHVITFRWLAAPGVPDDPAFDVDRVTVWKPEPWEPVLRGYLEGEADHQAEARAMALGGLA